MKIIIFLAFFALKLASATKIQSNCPRACYLSFSPICGYDPKTNTFQTFSNKCFLAAENDCQKKGYIAKYPGECKETTSECPIGCTDDCSPVCARNTYDDIYKTFPNLCSVEMENKCSKNNALYEVAYTGECQECFACKCPMGQSVCAYNYKTGSYQTFPCNCTLEKENICPTGNTPRDNFVHKYDGECQCSIDCPDNYDPVCAKSSDGTYQTFPTKCSLEAELKCNPNSANFVYKYDGQCKCPVFCTMDYRPVCAIDSTNGEEVTFGNQCGLYAANECPETENETKDYRYSFLRMGECESYDVPACPRACTKEYAPVCACDSKGNCQTFANECLLKSENECVKSNYYEIVKEGKCTETNPIELVDPPYEPTEEPNTKK